MSGLDPEQIFADRTNIFPIAGIESVPLASHSPTTLPRPIIIDPLIFTSDQYYNFMSLVFKLKKMRTVRPCRCRHGDSIFSFEGLRLA